MPGFEGIFAITGLMAVAYIVLGSEGLGSKIEEWFNRTIQKLRHRRR